MNKAEAVEKILNSLNTVKPQIITPSGKVYERHVDKLSKLLIKSVIEPIKVNVTSTCAEGDFEMYKNAVVWGVARRGENWLLTLALENEFALGFGSDPEKIMMHGFSSSDALGEWCV